MAKSKIGFHTGPGGIKQGPGDWERKLNKARQAQYEMGEGEICGFRVIEDREGEIEVVRYYSDQMPRRGRLEYQGQFERFLYQRDVELTRFPPVVCEKGHPLERATVISRIRDGKDFVFCAECGNRVDLPHLDKPGIGIRASGWLQHEEAAAHLRSAYEADLTRVKGYRRSWATPRCYLSCAPGQEKLTDRLRRDLQDAGVLIIKEIDRIEADDYVLVLDTPAYQQAYRQPTPEFMADAKLVKTGLRANKRRLVSIKLEGDSDLAPRHKAAECMPGDFCDASHYPVSLFDLVLTLYAIPLSHTTFAGRREALHQLWEETLAGSGEAKRDRAKFLRLLDASFKEDELAELCFELDIDFENLAGDTKKDKARELLIHCERNGLTSTLRLAVRQKRPHIQWPRL